MESQCYLPPGRVDIPAFTPAEAGTRFSDRGGMQGRVDIIGSLYGRDGIPAQSRSPIPELTVPDVWQLRSSDQRR